MRRDFPQCRDVKLDECTKLKAAFLTRGVPCQHLDRAGFKQLPSYAIHQRRDNFTPMTLQCILEKYGVKQAPEVSKNLKSLAFSRYQTEFP